MRGALAITATLLWFIGGIDFWIWFLSGPWKNLTVYLTPVITILFLGWIFAHIVIPFAVMGDEL